MTTPHKPARSGDGFVDFINVIKSVAHDASVVLGELALFCENPEMNDRIRKMDEYLAYIERLCAENHQRVVIPFKFPEGHQAGKGDMPA